ncbi:hypothetical protein FHX82_002274 [Amycolatopsis bartoniae]|uniref:Uncharacterized protein n=1 Tax=Amycolatopsis bartoniae TaxID=941986 RepID=A0A8H9J0V4_9PSEU|nr:hypothetical protein [Amycolatopsis bartoniae]MBB2935254.1 hypothetical protein [Amycolatopsis bartoniae]GHF75415.1 hypothetical protein GCM10017566_56740 [Amycolatopsis bartoniae]
MTVRIGDVASAVRRRGRDEDNGPDVADDRPRTPVVAQLRRPRHAWWYHLEFALQKSRA